MQMLLFIDRGESKLHFIYSYIYMYSESPNIVKINLFERSARPPIQNVLESIIAPMFKIVVILIAIIIF